MLHIYIIGSTYSTYSAYSKYITHSTDSTNIAYSTYTTYITYVAYNTYSTCGTHRDSKTSAKLLLYTWLKAMALDQTRRRSSTTC